MERHTQGTTTKRLPSQREVTNGSTRQQKKATAAKSATSCAPFAITASSDVNWSHTQRDTRKLFLSIWEGNWMPTHIHTKCWAVYLSRIRHVDNIRGKHETRLKYKQATHTAGFFSTAENGKLLLTTVRCFSFFLWFPAPLSFLLGSPPVYYQSRCTHLIWYTDTLKYLGTSAAERLHMSRLPELFNEKGMDNLRTPSARKNDNNYLPRWVTK